MSPELEVLLHERDLARERAEIAEDRADVAEEAAERDAVDVPAKVEVVRGVAGIALYINDYRVLGPKPWGGGTSIALFEGCTNVCLMRRALWGGDDT